MIAGYVSIEKFYIKTGFSLFTEIKRCFTDKIEQRSNFKLILHTYYICRFFLEKYHESNFFNFFSFFSFGAETQQ